MLVKEIIEKIGNFEYRDKNKVFVIDKDKMMIGGITKAKELKRW